MISSEVQRTLVKSPPELWAELSDPAALARHLGELGEIRITRTEPEKTVEWEAENTTGTVSIQASGWGTRVTLSVTKEIGGGATETADAELAADDANAAVKPSAAAEPDAVVEPDAVADVVLEPEAPEEPERIAAETAPAEAAPESRRGFFARLFGRKRKTEAAAPKPSEDVIGLIQSDPAEELTAADPTSTEGPIDQAPAAAIETTGTAQAGSAGALIAMREALTPENLAAIDPFAVALATQPAPRDTPPEPNANHQPDSQPGEVIDLAAELRAAEEVAEEEVTAVLAAVLDRLGAAHHRPFSRS